MKHSETLPFPISHFSSCFTISIYHLKTQSSKGSHKHTLTHLYGFIITIFIEATCMNFITSTRSKEIFFYWYQVPSLKTHTHTHSEKNVSTFTHTNWFHSPGSFEEKPTTNELVPRIRTRNIEMVFRIRKLPQAQINCRWTLCKSLGNWFQCRKCQWKSNRRQIVQNYRQIILYRFSLTFYPQNLNVEMPSQDLAFENEFCKDWLKVLKFLWGIQTHTQTPKEIMPQKVYK